ncbi:lysosome-associated membrane glycoprotein 3 isoform X2 [Antennarius striatus]|uniref:lysosome-associated membrane glycoprotein 3 isoform X2 n=1 Tax=Antennarius striatus TaxID=241820 RepID=UPI0035B0AAA5
MLTGHTGGGSVFLFVVFILELNLLMTDFTGGASPPPPGFCLQRNNGSVLSSSESTPPNGTYTLKPPGGKPCIKATLGVQYLITENKRTWYFNLDPPRVRVGGFCSWQTAALSLSLPDPAAKLEFTFTKENDSFHVTRLNVSVSPLPVCQGCANKTYSGLMTREKLFETPIGRSFKCKSENLLWISSELQVKLVPLQMQAFSLPIGEYGEEVECGSDHNKRVISVVMRVVGVGIVLAAVLTYLLLKNYNRTGHSRI